jgi:hypothetical protein
MNQVTNKVPYGLLSEEEQAQFCKEAKKKGLYNMWSTDWLNARGISFTSHSVYRLIIKDDEWYYIKLNKTDEEGRVIHGSNIGNLRSCYTVRPATPTEIEAAKPKELTLEEKVKAKYPDYEVCMLRINEVTGWLSYGHNGTSRVAHSAAQSDPRFQGYVYIHSENDWLVSNKPTKSSRNKYIQPVAVLFTRDK